ncbi:amino acid/polyamine transporter I [Aspergillus aurantiobrunneus]
MDCNPGIKKAEEWLEDRSVVEQSRIEGVTLRTEGSRRMTPLQTISASWIICNSWAGVAATVDLAIVQGGPVTLTYGLIAMFVLVGACALTLGELASVYPTAGGQYHWTSILAPKRVRRVMSYACGIANMFAWIAICTGIAIIPAQLILGLVIFYYPGYDAQPWHYFLIYQGINGLVVLYNIGLLKRSLWIHDAAFFITLASFLAITIACLSRSAGNYEPSSAVWETFLNDSGWSSGGVAFLTGLVSPNYMYAGIDGALHLAEDCRNAATAVPWALVSTLTIGLGTSFAFMIAMLSCTHDLHAVVESSTGVPIFEIWHQATRSPTAATIFTVLLCLAATFALIGAQETASRLTWSLARDETLLGSKWIGKIHDKLDVPVWALVFNASVVFIIGCIYVGSSSAFNAFIGTGLILQHVSYAYPAVLLLYRRRASSWLPKSRKFRFSGAVGWPANVVTVCVAVLVLIFYNFPTVMPVTGSNMNYSSAVLGVMGIVACVNWVIYARHRYHGPYLRGFEGEESL